jgi:uracil DNA glycosylase
MTMLSEEQKRTNREEYFDRALELGTVKLILIGQDPYPKDKDNGIAFCKDKISDLSNTCFPTICKSLSLDFDKFEKQLENNGKKLFVHLLEKGILFMNLSYELFTKGSNRKELITHYHEENEKIICEFPKATIIKLGLNYQTLFEELYKSKNIIIHPSGLAKRHNTWKDYWIEEGALLEKFQFTLNK